MLKGQTQTKNPSFQKSRLKEFGERWDNDMVYVILGCKDVFAITVVKQCAIRTSSFYVHPLFPGGVFRVQYTVQYLKPPPPFFTIAENVIHYCSPTRPNHFSGL